MRRQSHITESRIRPDHLLTAAQVADILRVSRKRVYDLGIPAVRLSARTLRWRSSELARWISDRSANS